MEYYILAQVASLKMRPFPFALQISTKNVLLEIGLQKYYPYFKNCGYDLMDNFSKKEDFEVTYYNSEIGA